MLTEFGKCHLFDEKQLYAIESLLNCHGGFYVAVPHEYDFKLHATVSFGEL